MTQLRLSYFRHIMRRQEMLGKTIMMGETQNEKSKTKHEIESLNKGSYSLELARAVQYC